MLEKAGVKKHLDDSDLKGPTPVCILLIVASQVFELLFACLCRF